MEKWLSTIDVEQSFEVPAWTEYERSMFPTRLHAQHATLEEMGRAWAERRLAPLLSPREMQRVRDGQYGRLACQFWPFSRDEARSVVLIKFMYWVLLFDDLLLRGNAQRLRLFCGHLLHVMFGTALEEENVATIEMSPREMQRVGDGQYGRLVLINFDTSCRHLLHVMFGTALEGPDGAVELKHEQHLVSWSKLEKLVLEVGNEWWNDMKIDMSLTMQLRFASMVTSYVFAQLNFNHFREMPLDDEGHFHLNYFTPIRTNATRVPICLVLAEYDLGIELDEETLGSSLIQELNSAINDHIAWIGNFHFIVDTFK